MRRIHFALAWVAVWWALGIADAGAATPEDFELRIVIDSVTATEVWGTNRPRSVVTARVLLTSRAASLSGWSFGVEGVGLEGTDVRVSRVEVPANLQILAGGETPLVQTTRSYGRDAPTAPVAECAPRCFGGHAITQEIMIGPDGAGSLGPVNDLEVLDLEFRIDRILAEFDSKGRLVFPAQDAAIRFSDLYGNPLVAASVLVEGTRIRPAVLADAQVQPPCYRRGQFTMEIEGSRGITDSVAESTVTLHFDSDPENPNTARYIPGWSYGLCVSDSNALEILDATLAGTDTEFADDGRPPDFDSIHIHENGVTHGVLVVMKGTRIIGGIDPQNNWIDMIVTYRLHGEEGTRTHVVPCTDMLGWPPVANVMIIEGASVPASGAPGIDPATECCDPAICNRAGEFLVMSPLYTGGDGNGDGRLDIGDAIFVLQNLFDDGAPPPCLAAADFNGDGGVDIGDPIAIVTYLFQPEGFELPHSWRTGCQGDPLPLGCETAPEPEC